MNEENSQPKTQKQQNEKLARALTQSIKSTLEEAKMEKQIKEETSNFVVVAAVGKFTLKC